MLLFYITCQGLCSSRSRRFHCACFGRRGCQNCFESLLSLGFEPVRPQKPDVFGMAASAAPPSTVL
ncbi:hypothetical protein [Microcoleus vaginatus]|uniref:hypothetical protein n=1 Tax=Microcoleus vaginatus TaxID=119532 RepID=UPI00404096E0